MVWIWRRVSGLSTFWKYVRMNVLWYQLKNRRMASWQSLGSVFEGYTLMRPPHDFMPPSQFTAV